MISILVDHNMEGQAVWLWDTLVKIELPDLIDIGMFMFTDINLPDDSNDRVVWRFAQNNDMILLTDNRSNNEVDSLEQTIREENALDSLPVLTIASLDKMRENNYRVRCAERISEIVLDLKNYMGTGRIFIP
jgi:hypothetical protein